MEEVKAKIESFENQIKQTKRIDNEICFSDLCMYPYLESPSKVQVPISEKYNKVDYPWIHLHFYGIAMSQYTKNEEFHIHTFLSSLKALL